MLCSALLARLRASTLRTGFYVLWLQTEGLCSDHAVGGARFHGSRHVRSW